MKAIVSGRSGTALILDGDSLQSFDLDDPDNLMVRHLSELPYLFGEAQDLRILEHTDVAAVAHELEREHNFTCALDLTLISLDSELADDIRHEALQELEGLFTDGTLIERVENVMYSAPLPEDADLMKAQELCDANLKLVQGFLQRLEDHQPAITSAVEAWETIPVDKFPTFENKQHFRYVAVREGLWRALTTLESPASVSTFFLKANLNRSVQQLPNYRQVLQEWTKPFRQSSETRMMVAEDDEQPLSEQRFGKRARIDRRAVLREAVKKKSVIVGAMHRRDLARVADLIDELVTYQQTNSESRHTAKSLCDLAMEAKALGIDSLQLSLTERAINIAPGDGWSWAQHGDALLRVGRLDAALRAYEQANAFGAGVVAKNGRAEVLKAQGEFALALKAFDEVIKHHPENVVAKAGRAEVLKAQGQLTAALNAFDEVIKQHLENVVAKNGRAEVLKAQGQFAAALKAFDEVIEQHPENVVAKNGRAEVLKAQGQFAAALMAFDEVIEQHPENVVAKAGRAEVLKAQGQFAAALNAFDEVIKQHPENVVAKNGRAEVLKAQGQFAAALKAFDEVVEQHPENVVAKNGRAEVLKAQGQFATALKAFDEVIKQHPENVVAKTGRAEVLKAQGQFAAALNAFDEVIKQHPENVVAKTGRAEVLKAQGQFAAALSAFDEVIEQHPEDVVAKNGRAEVLKAQGQFAESLAAFDDVINKHPHNRVTRNGRSSVLVALGRYAEALHSLPTTAPIDEEDWIAYHVRGMCMLRLGESVAAIKIFSNGLQNCPFASHVEYFRGALGLSWLRGRHFKQAAETLNAVTSPLLQPSANVIRIHVFGAQGQRERAIEAYESLANVPHLQKDPLTMELHHQYILSEQPTKDEEWIFDGEVRMFLRVA
jgi:tetratricopeptide (TPR) repeat protein